ncbi:DUF4238 domain-containing protein [Tabrizicola piscis]|uniref:DUF4238 domain-containing protein n=1 Tax=Tabrizicola piscis TaxID=2494374 RepID=A0A3S8U5I5_9RHOB|nr:DUF4238 domain-containing protein [Tabrizicola piscis]AZL58800.1 DUF4238 domain-containing protein [Tabrizicola piscis]
MNVVLEMTSRTKKQHVVPRFYLNKFCDPGGLVWTYSSGNNPRADKPEATAVETNFYSPIGGTGERFDEVEKLLGAIEGNAAPLWDKLTEGKVFKGEEREHIALFLAAQYLRSPSVVGAGAEMMAHLAHHTAQLIASDQEVHEQSVDRYEEATGDVISPEEREKMRTFLNDPSNFSISVLRSAGLPMLGGIGNLANIFLNMKWVVGRSKDQHLITSDSPVTRVSDPATHRPFYGDGAFANKTVRVSFPLTPTRIVELTWQGEERERVVEIPKRMAREMNGLRAAQAERFVYASLNDDGIVRLCDKWLDREKRPKIVTSSDVPSINVKRKL